MFNPKVLNVRSGTPAPSNDVPAHVGRRFGTNPIFRQTFQRMVNKQGSPMVRNPRGIDNARGLGQAIASVKGRNNAKRIETEPSVNPVTAALQHSVRNRSVEQGGNAVTAATLPAGAGTQASSVFKFIGGTR